jgi:hypothetical protein
MDAFLITRAIPDKFVVGLADKSLRLFGGVIRDAKTGQIVAHLREVSEVGKQISSVLTGLSPYGSVAGVLNLGVTTMGFAVVLRRLGIIEQQLQQAQEVLSLVGYKIDLSFYANLRAALDLATNAFTMANPENRKASAMQAINRFLEAEQHYMHLEDNELNRGSQVADEYLSTLTLAYVTEARCYLELEELATAHRRLQEGVAVIRSRTERLVNTLLTSNPAAYLHPRLKDQIDLHRLTRVYQWLNPELDEATVFEAQRENLFKLAQRPQEWLNSLPAAIQVPKEGSLATRFMGTLQNLPKKVPGRKATTEEPSKDREAQVYERLPSILELIEFMMESERRFEAYGLEVQSIRELGMSFKDWTQLAPPADAESDDSGLMCIIPAQPIKV